MPAWLDVAEQELGQCEIAGEQDNPRILEYYAKAGFPEIKHDETAWCAAFANFCLAESGLPTTGSLMARSFLGYGKKIAQPEKGCIVVLKRGKDPSQGHVGFWSHEKDGRVFLLGGNQGDKVSVASFSKANVLDYRMPSDSVKVSRKVLGTGTAATGAGAGLALPNVPDLSQYTAWQSFGDTLSGLIKWGIANPIITGALALWIGACVFAPKILEKTPWAPSSE